jgi:hypothetical protein
LQGPYLGRKIRWRALPEGIQAEVLQFADSER